MVTKLQSKAYRRWTKLSEQWETQNLLKKARTKPIRLQLVLKSAELKVAWRPAATMTPIKAHQISKRSKHRPKNK